MIEAMMILPGARLVRGEVRPRQLPPGAREGARIGPPPSGYLYVSLDGDLLKLAVGTLLVVDAIDG